MSEYRRYYVKGGTYFFTVVTYRRCPVFDNPYTIKILDDSFSAVQRNHPFTINAIVVLPDRLHTIWTLPPNEMNFSPRWMLIKNQFTRLCKRRKDIASFALDSNHRIWQKRFWEHLIRDQEDFNDHCDYIHLNPVKHGFVTSPADWTHSSFSNYVEKGYYDNEWGQNPESILNMNLE